MQGDCRDYAVSNPLVVPSFCVLGGRQQACEQVDALGGIYILHPVKRQAAKVQRAVGRVVAYPAHLSALDAKENERIMVGLWRRTVGYGAVERSAFAGFQLAASTASSASA